MMHLTWARQLLDNREFVLVEGRHPSSDPKANRGVEWWGSSHLLQHGESQGEE